MTSKGPNTTATIDWFAGEYRFLSNFYPLRRGDLNLLWLYGEEEPQSRYWRTLEHAFQAAKFPFRVTRDQVEGCALPTEARYLGRTIEGTRTDWTKIRVETMGRLLRMKFKDPMLQTLLLKTGDRDLIEGNYWGDSFWGIPLFDKDTNGNMTRRLVPQKGRNILGRQLMNIRQELRQGGLLDGKDSEAGEL